MVPAFIMTSAPGPVTVFNGREYVYFGGTGYLGLAAHPEVIEAGCEALRNFGVHTATSRSRLGTNPPLLAVERNAAAFFGTEDAFYFGSGYVGNQIMVSALAADVDAIHVDEAAHYSVWDAARHAGKPVFPFPHGDPQALRRNIGKGARVLVMADAVGPSSGRLAPVRTLVEALRECEKALLLLDDAHGFGVLGPDGRGAYDAAGLWDQVNRSDSPETTQLYVCGTLAKALGGFGGIIPGSAGFIAKIRAASNHTDGSSAPASPVAGASAKALEIVLREPGLRLRLRKNTHHLRDGLREMGLTVPDGETAHFGVSIGDAKHMRSMYESLRERGIMLPYVATYSGIPADGILRFAVFANHTTQQIDRLLDELKRLV